MTRKPPPKPAPSARKPAARGTVAAASAAQRKSAAAPARRAAAPVAKAPEPHKKGAPAPKLTAAQEKAAASHKPHAHAAEQPRRPAVGAQQAQQDPDRGGLTGPVRPEETVYFADRHAQVKCVKRTGPAE